jgi:hypothetical protein
MYPQKGYKRIMIWFISRTNNFIKMDIEKKTEQFRMRMSKAEKIYLAKKAKELNVTVASLIRNTILTGEKL